MKEVSVQTDVMGFTSSPPINNMIYNLVNYTDGYIEGIYKEDEEFSVS